MSVCLLIICVVLAHDKGHGEVLGQTTLKSRLFQILQQEPSVMAIVSAQPKDGGLEASYILVS